MKILQVIKVMTAGGEGGRWWWWWWWELAGTGPW